MKFELLSPAVEIGLITTNLDAMVDFYEHFLELQCQGTIDFPGGSQRRYTFGNGVLKLVTYTEPPALPPVPGGGHAQAGLRYFSIGVKGVRAAESACAAAGFQIVEPLTEFAAVPGMGWFYVADPDGNWLELFGTL